VKDKQPDVYLVNNEGDRIEGVHRFSHEAMATIFDALIQHPDYQYSRQAAIAAFNEIDRIEQDLSHFVENSDISRLNDAPADTPVQLGIEAFQCLAIAQRICSETGGAFDVTVGALFACLLDEKKQPRKVSPEQLKAAIALTGCNLLELDDDRLTVRKAVAGVRIDLGGIGKGFAVDKVGEMLGEWKIERAMIHGGYSTVLATKAPQGARGWPITFSNPLDLKQTIVRMWLANEAVSGSGLAEGMHIIDPRKAKPITGKIASWSCAADAAGADGLSTAFMVMDAGEIEAYCRQHKSVRGLVAETGGDGKTVKFKRYGDWGKVELLV
jgi:thiamine biosynthesis lipoprotein